MLALSLVLPPILVFESMATTANLQWPLLAALFWALARPITARWDLAACVAIAVAASLCSSVVFLFLPLAVMVLVLRRGERRARIVPAVFFAGCFVQLVAVLTTSDSASRGKPDVLSLPRLYVVNVVGETFLGHRLVDSVWLDVGIWLFIVLAVAVTAAVVVLWLRCDVPGRIWGSAALVMSVGVYCSTVFWRGVDQVELHEGVQTGSGARYTGLGLQLLVAAFVILIDRARLGVRRASGRRRAARGASRADPGDRVPPDDDALLRTDDGRARSTTHAPSVRETRRTGGVCPDHAHPVGTPSSPAATSADPRIQERTRGVWISA